MAPMDVFCTGVRSIWVRSWLMVSLSVTLRISGALSSCRNPNSAPAKPKSAATRAVRRMLFQLIIHLFQQRGRRNFRQQQRDIDWFGLRRRTRNADRDADQKRRCGDTGVAPHLAQDQVARALAAMDFPPHPRFKS